MAMGRMQGFLILLGLIGCAIESTSGISCYVCNSHYQKDCSSNEKKKLEKYKVDCNANVELANGTKSNAYLSKLFGPGLVENKAVAMSTAIGWDKKQNYSKLWNCNAGKHYQFKPSTNKADRSWFESGFKSVYPNVNYNYDICDSGHYFNRDVHPLMQTYYRAKGTKQGVYAKEYNACRIIVMQVKDEMKMNNTEKGSFDDRIARTCSTVLEKENSKEYTDDKILENGCKDYKSAKTEVRVCLCKGKDLCNGTPKGFQSLSTRLILASVIGPIFFRLWFK